MKKYLTVFNVSWQNGFIYRLNFILWRVRSVILVLSVYFFWDAIFSHNQMLFGYTREKILTYVFLTLILRSFILGGRSIDVGGEISDGRLSNYLLRPINYLYYWFTRDLADRLLNIIFAIGEFVILFFILKPDIYFQGNVFVVMGFLASVVIGVAISYLLGSLTSYTTFWTPGNTWGFWFVYMVFQDLLAGVMFPLDILPKIIYQLVMLTPFPYLLYFPANTYLGKIAGSEIVTGLVISIIWLVILYYFVLLVWRKGIKTYQSEGR